jgi:hypothetical protein
MADKQLKGREKKIEDKSNKDKIRKKIKIKNRETLISRKEEKDKKANTRCRH